MINDFNYLKPGTLKEALAMYADTMIVRSSVVASPCSL
jgi:hypothetical protein